MTEKSVIDLYWPGAPLPEIASEMREEEKGKLFLYFFTEASIHGCINVQPANNISFLKQNLAQIGPILVAEGGGVEMAGSTNLVVPIVLWGRSPPAHCISTVYLLRDQRTMVTGSHDGQVVVWQLEDTHTWQFTPRHMLIGHTAPVR